MKFEEYSKLMKTPFDELSEKDKKKRTTEFSRRLKVCLEFLNGVNKGYVKDDIADSLPGDDPMKDGVEMVKLQVNEIEGKA